MNGMYLGLVMCRTIFFVSVYLASYTVYLRVLLFLELFYFVSVYLNIIIFHHFISFYDMLVCVILFYFILYQRLLSTKRNVNENSKKCCF